MARPIVVVKIKGRTRKFSSISDKTARKIANGEIIARTGIKEGNKIRWIGSTGYI